MNPKLKNALVFGGGVIATLLVVKLVKTYVLPKAPASVQSAAAKILP
jgi:hypothetical protein